MYDLNQKLKVLVIAAHSDDEVLGCAGTLLHHKERGDDINLMFMTNGVGSRGTNDGASQRFLSSKSVSQKLGTVSHTQLDFADNKLDSVPLLDIIKEVESIANCVNPDIIYTHHPGDLNIDHKVCSNAVLTAFRPLPNTNFTQIYSFEVQSSTEWSPHDHFTPNHYVNISKYLEKKKLLFCEYEDEIRSFPHPRSLIAIDSLAKWRGASSGFEAAEAFMVLRSRWF
jgi:N-acetylglucosamine malate deacetylase 1